MQLGTRWPAHTTPPHSLDTSVVEAVHEVERDLKVLKQDTSDWYWTLTYLENRPVIQLDDGTTIRVGTDGSVSISHED